MSACEGNADLANTIAGVHVIFERIEGHAKRQADRCNTQHRSTVRLVFVPSVAEWALAFISCGLTHH
jgi:hypothetical protein